MGATQLGVYNDAMQIIGERSVASLSEDSEARRSLDAAWTKGGVASGGPIYCLELGYWNHATRTAALVYSPSVEPPFGFTRAFDKPVDWVRTVSIASDPYFLQPMTMYSDEADFWFSDLDVIFVKYISKDNSYGLDMSTWPMSFEDFVAMYLADSIVERISSSAPKQKEVHDGWQEAKKRANGIDGTNKPTQMIPLGTWANARYGSWGRLDSRWREN